MVTNKVTYKMQFSDGASEMELRLNIGGMDISSTKDILVDTNDTSLAIRVLRSGSPITLIETNPLFDKIKSSETIWFVLFKVHYKCLNRNSVFSPSWLNGFDFVWTGI